MRLAHAAAAAMLAGCSIAPPDPPTDAARAGPVRNPSFEEPDSGQRCAPGWDCVSHADPDSFRFYAEDGAASSGRRSFCIERVTQEPWALVRQVLRHEALRGSRLRLSMAVRVERASGPGAGPWVLVEGPTLVNEIAHVRDSASWRRASVEFEVPYNATALVIGATLEGAGKACFDDVRLEPVAKP